MLHQTRAELLRIAELLREAAGTIPAEVTP
jgi:hypothetical protein